ncbi:hypothetical protein QJQ45_017840, partial [Haematococcus lacustris]
QGKAAKAKPARQPGRWLDRDCNAAPNMQRIGESRWRPLELCYWPDQGALPAKGKEYPGLGYKRLRDKPPKAQQQQQPAAAQAVPEDPDFDIVDRDEAGQPDLTEAQRKRKASGEARAARSRDNTFHARKAKLAHLTDHLPQALWDAFLDKAVRPRVKAISERGVIGSLLLGFLVRGLFTLHVADQLDAQGQPLSYTDTDIPVSATDIPNLSCRNLFLQLARLDAIPRNLSDTNMVDHVGKQLETAFSNMLTLLFAGRLKKSVSLAGAKVLLGTNEHQRRFGAEVDLQRGLLGLGEGEKVDHDWVEDPANRGRLLRHAVHTTREMEAAMAAWQLDMVPWEQSQPTNLVASRWDALLPDPRRQKLASPKHRFDQVVHTDGVAISVMFLRPKPAAPPAELPRMAKGMGAVNPLAHLHAWLGVDPGKTNMATVAHEERSADGSVVSVRHWTLTAGQYYRDSGITRQTQATKIWLATVKTQLTALSHVSSKPSSLVSYRRFADTVLETYDAMWAEVSKTRWANAKFRLYCGKKRVVASFWAKVNKQAKKLWPDRILALAYGAAGFKGSGTIGCRGAGSSADNTPSETLLDTPPESFRWLRPVKSMAKRSQVRGLMCLTSINNITRFYDRDVSAALNIRRCAGNGLRL